jgi:hypothetical protein
LQILERGLENAISTSEATADARVRLTPVNTVEVKDAVNPAPVAECPFRHFA